MMWLILAVVAAKWSLLVWGYLAISRAALSTEEPS